MFGVHALVSAAPGVVSRTTALPHRPVRQQLGFDFAATPRPFLKWVGGKTSLLGQLLPLLPVDIATRRYFEPFAGGGALFFRIRPCRAVLADINAQLMATYRCVQGGVEALLEQLCRLEQVHSVEQYYVERSRYNAASGAVPSLSLCAQFIYLNKTCYNGLHRVNRRGEFNVPAGRYRAPRIVDATGLRAAHSALQGVTLHSGTFETVLEDVKSGDFVYLDPPYDIEPGTKAFTSYAASAFGPEQQDVLAVLVRSLDRRGCKWMLSNSDTAANRARYARFDVIEVKAPRAINCKATQRGAVREIVVRNY